MTSDLNRALAQLSREELERLLAAKGEIERLEARRDELQRELQEVESSLEELVRGAAVTGRGDGRDRAGGRKKKAAKKAGGKKSAKKKTTTKTAKKTAKKAAKKTGAEKTAGKATKKTTQKTDRKTAKKPAGRRGSSGGAGTLEDVIVRVLQESGEPMSFKALLESIVMNKLFVSRSKNFDNVLRRTLSTSDRVRRVARGVYAV